MDPSSSSVAAENPMDETAPLETDEEFDEDTDEEELDRILEEQHEEWLRKKVPLKTAEELEEWVLRMSDKITPIEFEPRNYWVPEDSSTWKNYPEANPRFLLPNRDSQTPGDEIDGAFVFELYSIEVTKLDLKSTFSPIAMACRGTDYKRVVIYNHPNGEEVILNEPLPLKGPFRLASADSFVSLHFGPGWGYAADDQTFSSQQTKRDTPLYMSVEDFEIDSQVLFSYELITLAVKAEVVFRFLGEEKEYPIRIISGIIFATNDGDSRTKRIIKSFSSVPVLSNKELEVDRFAFGVPKSSNLQVSVDLMYTQGDSGLRFRMSGSVNFFPPQVTGSEEQFFTCTGTTTRLSVVVHWSDPEATHF